MLNPDRALVSHPTMAKATDLENGAEILAVATVESAIADLRGGCVRSYRLFGGNVRVRLRSESRSVGFRAYADL